MKQGKSKNEFNSSMKQPAKTKNLPPENSDFIFQSIIDNLDDAVFSVDRDYSYTSFNNNHKLRMKLLYGADIELGKSIFYYMDLKEDADKLKSIFDDIFSNGKESSTETFMGNAAYARKHFRIYYRPILNSNQEISGILMISKDISKHKMLEKEKEEFENKFRTLFMYGPDATYVANASDGFMYEVNTNLSELFGYAMDEMIGHTSSELGLWVVYDDRVKLVEELKKCGYASIETIGRRKNGETFDALVAIRAIALDNKQLIIGTVRDISRRIKVNKALMESELMLSSIINSINDLIWAVDAKDFGIIKYNQGLKDYFLKFRNIRLEIGMRPEELFESEEYVNIWKGLYNKALNEGNFKTEYETIAGKKILELSLNPLIKDDENIGISVFAEDITERKQSEIDLRESEMKYRTLFDTAEGAILLFTDGCWVDCNVKALKIFGCTREQIIGKNPIIFSPPVQPDGKSSAKEAVIKINLAYTTGPQFFDWVHCRADGTPFNAEVSLKSLNIGGKPYIQAIVLDVTELKKSKQSLAESEKLFQSSFDSANVGMCLVGIDGKFMKTNQELSNIFGFTEEEFKNFTFNDITFIEDRDLGSNALKNMLDNKISKTSIVKRYLHKEGRIIWGQASIAIVKDSENRPLYFVTYIQDITHDIRNKEEIEEKNISLIKALDGTINTMVNIVEMKDPYTSGHQKRVSEIAVQIAKKLKKGPKFLNGVLTAALIHDIGKITIPESILLKPTSLNKLEFEMIKEHSMKGYEMVKGIDFGYPVAEIILKHHERINGSGYPNQLKGPDILLEAKIIAVADVFEAMTSHRPHRPAFSLDETLKELRENKDILYDGKVVDACIDAANKNEIKKAG